MKEFFTKTEHIYQYVKGYSEWAVDESDGVYMAAITEAIESANSEFDMNVDPTDYASYIEWLANENHT